MAAIDKYRVRPSPEKGRQDILKILLPSTTFLILGINPGQICYIGSLQKTIGPAIAWNSTEKIKDDVVQVSKALQELYGLRLDSKVSISPSDQKVVDAHNVSLCEIPQDDSDCPLPELSDEDRLGWASGLVFPLQKTNIIVPGLIIEKSDPQRRKVKRKFQIQQVNSSDERTIYRAQMRCTVQVIGSFLSDNKRCDGLGGLEKQQGQINEEISRYCLPLSHFSRFPEFAQPYNGGILLHGPSGTGKSLVLQNISQASWQGVYWISLDEDNDYSKPLIDQIFVDALNTQPSVLLIDNLDSDEHAKINKTLYKQFNRLGDSRVLVVGVARELSGIDQNLRSAGCFEQEIEFPVPDLKSRAEILRVLGNLPKDQAHPTLESLATRTHGFVGKDLKLLFRRAVKIYHDRAKSSDGDLNQNHDKVDPGVLLAEMSIDFDEALLHVHPSAMHDVFIEPPNVRWTDVAGQHEVKELLEEIVVWPRKYSKNLEKHRSKAKKGLLLYGPPGCSKTMIAKAAATEAKLNFIAIKGAELTSMYVGESERKLREMFRKARDVQPSIMFFDEIDAIGTSEAHSRNGGLQTVTTLLNELDGFRAMEGVFVLAATNKPEVLDLALIRAGRLDTCLYVGLPDVEARREILKLQMLDMYIRPDVDVEYLVEATEGYSGAEIVRLCQAVRNLAVREEIKLQEDRKVCQEHFKTALTQAEKSTTEEMVRRYKAWGAARQ